MRPYPLGAVAGGCGSPIGYAQDSIGSVIHERKALPQEGAVIVLRLCIVGLRLYRDLIVQSKPSCVHVVYQVASHIFSSLLVCLAFNVFKAYPVRSISHNFSGSTLQTIEANATNLP